MDGHTFQGELDVERDRFDRRSTVGAVGQSTLLRCGAVGESHGEGERFRFLALDC